MCAREQGMVSVGNRSNVCWAGCDKDQFAFKDAYPGVIPCHGAKFEPKWSTSISGTFVHPLG